jgi:prenyltransferase beta subunit
LAKSQNDDGSFGQHDYGRNVGVCSLVGLSFVSNGSTPGRGPYGKQVNRVVDFILHGCQDSGFITVTGSTSHGPMYEHGFATLLLAEMYGMSPSNKLRERLVSAVKLIVDKQNSEGGWRYQPERRDADISVTICQIMALRAARNAGIYVPNDTIDRCIDYVKRSQNVDGGFSYMLSARGSSLFPRSAAGVVALYSAGIYEGDEIQRGLTYLIKFVPGKDHPVADDGHYFYGQYYAAQAMWQAGGTYWDKWYPAIHKELIARQRPNGSWLDAISPEYGTAMACLVLQTPNSYLPIFQK